VDIALDDLRAANNRRVLRKAGIASLLAFSLCFAMIPLYSIWCDITGQNGKGARMNPAAAVSHVDTSRTVRVQFLAAVNSNLAWNFKPEVNFVDVHPGAVITAWFDASNTSGAEIVGNAVPSVAPNEASLYFNKTECFCFTEQALKAGEARRMPVKFVVDTGLPKAIRELTLAYTFYRNDLATNRLAKPALVLVPDTSVPDTSPRVSSISH
jgi:cytochrome c oxidase assembly protein subunit 11